MFTGLVETTAEVARLERRGPTGAKLALRVALDRLELGESIAVSGVCLTVTRFDGAGFEADVSAETLAVTTLGRLRPGDRVNLERASRLGDRMGGHVVLGHVDGVGTVRSLDPVGDARALSIDAPEDLQRFIAAKGSIAIDGVSLTVNRLSPPAGFEIMLVPHTLAVTTLDDLLPGAALNLEVDVLARYVARQLDHAGIVPSRDQTMLQKLREGGFVP